MATTRLLLSASVLMFCSQTLLAQTTGRSYTNTIEIGKDGAINPDEKIKAAKEEEEKKEAERLERRKEIAKAKADRQKPLTEEEAEAKSERKERYAKLEEVRRQRKAAAANPETRAKNMAALGLARSINQARLREITAQQRDAYISAQNQFGEFTGSGRVGYTRQEIVNILTEEKAKKAILDILSRSSIGFTANFVGYKLHRDHAPSTPFVDSEWESFAEKYLNILSSENRAFKVRNSDRWKAGQP